MDDSRHNKIKISGDVQNSTISVNQNQDGAQAISEKHIEYVVDDNSYREISTKSANKSNQLFLVTLAVSALAILADIGGLLSYIGIQSGIILLIILPICVLTAIFTSHDRWLLSLPEDESATYKDGLWYEKLNKETIAMYMKRGKCIYPKCKGVINIVPAPVRERPNHSLIGKCSIGGVQHTYTVDFNGIGYPQKFNWIPLAQDEQKA